MAYLRIVDDDFEFAQAVGTYLRGEGHEIAIETHAEKTVQRIPQRRPDVVILDVVFPDNERAGFGVAHAVEQTFGNLPILLLTGVQQHFPGEHRETADGGGLLAAEFMEKPLDFKTLGRRIAQLLAARARKA